MKNNNVLVFDLYLSGSCGRSPTKTDIIELDKVLPLNLKSKKFKKKLTDKNYGKGADWPVLFIQYLNNEYISSVLNFISLVEIGKKILDLIRIKKEQSNSVLLGCKSASYVGYYYVEKNFLNKEFTLISSMEIDRGNFEYKKEFIITFKEKNVEFENNIQINSNKDESIFGKLIIIHLDWYGNLKSINTY